MPLPFVRSRARAGALAITLLISMSSLAAGARAATIDNQKLVCAYTAHSISTLDYFDSLVGRNLTCASVYNNASPNWQGWTTPWFINYYNPDSDWSAWATQPGTQRQLIITQNLAPTSATDQSDWLSLGAAGTFEPYARQLAQNLVNAGLGNSIIRLSPEMNGTWYADSIGSTPAQWALWDQFWRNTVTAMRSVPGAHFLFDWCIVDGWRPIPLADYYPGDNWVDIVGIDVYDTGNIGSTAQARWNTNYNGPTGIGAFVAFAAAHAKPISIPEWGVSPTNQSDGFGDDPTFVNGIAQVVKNNPTAFQSYFYKYGYAMQLAPGTQSLAAYRAHFGAVGDSVGSPSSSPGSSGTSGSHGSGSGLSPSGSSNLTSGVGPQPILVPSGGRRLTGRGRSARARRTSTHRRHARGAHAHRRHRHHHHRRRRHGRAARRLRARQRRSLPADR